ncbi:MAG: sigma-54 dependent transcriptional regulator, partial [Candidatus Eiseniibacteriota bacterium]
MTFSVLVIDDERSIRSSLERVLSSAGYRVETAATVADGRRLLGSYLPDVVIMDLKLPDGNGVELLHEIQSLGSDIETIVITAYGDVESAVGAMKAGAGDFLKKPYSMDELLLALRGACKKVSGGKLLDGYRRRALQDFRAARLIGGCDAMRAVGELIGKVSASDATSVLIEGESGTGKELVARSIHYKSARADYALMEVNCSSFQDNLLENELFGHERGAFTDAREMKKGLVELCDQGTLFLDEVAEMSAPAQAKLLRFLDQKSFKRLGGTQDIAVDIRIVAATNKGLADCVSRGDFREDLYYRLKVVSIHMPPLRERGSDILELAEHFLAVYNRKFEKKFSRISPATRKLLAAYPWPGNVRELQNVIERVVLLENAREVRPEMLPPEITSMADTVADRMLPLDQVEANHIRRVLEATGGNKSRTARILGISRQSLLDRLKRYALQDSSGSRA